MRLDGVYHVRVLERLLNVKIGLRALVRVEKALPQHVKVHVTPRGMILVDIRGLTAEELVAVLTGKT